MYSTVPKKAYNANHMQFLRKTAVFLAACSLLLLLPLTAATWTARATLLNRDQVKAWMAESRVYDNFIDELAQTFEKQQKEQTVASETEGFDVVIVVNAVKKAFPPATLQQNVESVLDGTYAWLEGDAEKLSFQLNLEEQKKVFAEEIGNQALTRAVSLPPCPEGQLPDGFDPFSATCLPSGANISAEIDKLKQEVLNSKELLGDTTLSADEITVQNTSGEEVKLQDTLQQAPQVYQFTKASPLVVGALTLMATAIVIFLTRPRRSGLKILAWTYGIPGVLILLMGLGEKLFNSSFNQLITSNSSNNNMVETIVVPLIGQINNSLIRWNLLFGSLYLSVTIACVSTLLVLRRKTEAQTPQEAPSREGASNDHEVASVEETKAEIIAAPVEESSKQKEK